MGIENDPYILIHENRVCSGIVLCHGFTGSTAEIHACGHWLFEQGFHAAAVLLPGHGSTTADLAQTHWPDWYNQVQQSYLNMCQRTDKVFLLGVSLGGLLCLRVASVHPNVAGVITMGTPLKLMDPLARRWIIQLGRLFIQNSATEVKPGQKGYYYDERPLTSILELMDVRDEVRKRLPQVRCPVFIMHSRRDPTASFKAVKIMTRHLGSQQVYVYSTDLPEHVFLPPYNNPGYMKVWEPIRSFIRNPAVNPVTP